VHDLANQATANINANTNFSKGFNKGWIKFEDCCKTDLLSHCEYQQIIWCLRVNLLHLSSAQKLEFTFTTQVTVI